MHPWTSIIGPADHDSLSIEQFASNQDKLITGFDLYHSIRYLMTPSKNKSVLLDGGIPPWSHNVFKQPIPVNRNCRDAKIPKEFCPCTAERSDMAPSFYVGHSQQEIKKYPLTLLTYDWKSHQFAAPKLPGRMTQKTEIKYDDVALNRNVIAPSCNATIGSYINEKMLQDSWGIIDNITALFPAADVSGGIFLYPRQSILLTFLIQREIDSRVAKNGNSKNLEPFRICETGFGAGHSAALFLSAAPNVEVVSFDLYNRPYQTASFTALRGIYGKRLTRVIGDSCNTVKNYGKRCDFLHGSSLCGTDNIDLIHKSGSGVTLTSTAMRSLEDRSVYFGKRFKWAIQDFGEDAQWATLRKNSCIDNIVCFEEESRTLEGNLHLARGREQTISHKFCFAVNTGTCENKKKQLAVASSWRKDGFCSEWMHSPPPHVNNAK